ncbi:MAG: hypothetical protein EBU88_02355 [Acidobacteria bacterium]|nr:hypothetical protein [Acidobacteriota bacterium]
MSRNDKSKIPGFSNQDPNDRSGSPAQWFRSHLSRRAIGKGMAISGIAGIAGVSIYYWAVPSDESVALDSLELQRREGWAVGTEDEALRYGGGEVSLDSRNQSFSTFDPSYLMGIYQPVSQSWQPYFIPTMLQSLAQPSLNSKVRLFHDAAAGDAYRRAGGLGELLTQSNDAGRTLLIADLPGPATVAVGARLADRVTLVPAFDNWPHPRGVVPAHETLGSMLYYAREIEEKRLKPGANSPAMIMLDSRRLSEYRDSSDQFDNRWVARVPSTADLRERGMDKVIYLVADNRQTTELDDLNEEFVEWRSGGIDVRMLRLSDFRTAETGLASGAAAVPSTTGDRYYYGGSSAAHWLFFAHYALMPPLRIAPLQGAGPALSRPASLPVFQPAPYQPVRRATIFSNARTATSSSLPTGVGKIRPTGFGRTSVRMSSDGRVTGTAFGRSGSFGRGGSGFSG